MAHALVTRRFEMTTAKQNREQRVDACGSTIFTSSDDVLGLFLQPLDKRFKLLLQSLLRLLGVFFLAICGQR